MHLPSLSTLWSALTTPSRWHKRVGWALCGLLGTWLLAWLAMPPLLQWQLQKQGSAYLGRTLTVEQVEFHPWSLELTLKGLQLAQTSGQQAQLRIDSLYIDAELQSLLRLAPVIDAVTIEHPQLTLRHLGQGQTDVDDIIAKLNTPDDGSPPARFAVFNIQVSHGQAHFTDETTHTQHTLQQLQLGIPFLSNFGSRRDILTQPHLSFLLNDTPFNTSAQTTPFAANKHTQAQLHIEALDLTDYQAYWPKNWPLQLQSGLLSTDLQVVFEDQDEPSISLNGTISLQQLHLLDASTANPSTLLRSENLHLTLDNTQPLLKQLRLRAIHWQAPDWQLQRDAQGTLNLERIAQAFSRRPKAPTHSAPTTTTATSPWQVSIAQFDLQNGQIHWTDASTQPAAQLQLSGITLHSKAMQWPQGPDTELNGQAQLNGAALTWSGQASTHSARLNFSTRDLPLSLLAPYLAQHLNPAVQGDFSTQGTVQWKAAGPKAPAELRLQLPQTTLKHLTLATPKQALASIDQVQANNLQIDVPQQRIQVGNLSVERPQLQAGRNPQGQWMYQSWLKASPPATGNAPKPAPTTQPSHKQPSWQLLIDQFQLKQGQLRWVDESTSPAVRLQLADMDTQVKQLAWPATRKQGAATVQARLQLQDLKRKRPATGTVSYNGQFQLAPNATANWLTQGVLNIDKLPVEALNPYFASALNLDLVRASTHYHGKLQASMAPQGLDLQLQGQLAVTDFHANTLRPTEDLLHWKNLQLDQLKLHISNNQLRQLHVQQTSLSDYFARVIVQASGRINLQDLTRPSTTAQPAPTPASPVIGSAPLPPPADIRFGPITVVNGRVDFSDYFIRPNYSASLSQLTGTLGSFQNAAPTATPASHLADLTLQGYAQGQAPVHITGQLNPLSTPLELNIRATASDLDLPPLTPYSLKYVGHGIERGKLSMDVSYNIDNSGHLQASNRIVLNQLSLGPRDSESQAPNLPVGLALALLADRNGNIQVDLPISGSINDPDFHLGGIIVRLFINLIGKALTSPFTLLAHALGGGDELNTIEFAAGRSSLSPTAQQRLQTIAQAMQDKPSLQLTITGESHLQKESTAYRQAKLEKSLLAEKQRRWEKEGSTEPRPTSYTDQERPALLKAVYRRADIPKPRNWVGLTKDLPEADMEALLLTSYTVSEQTMEALANERALQVQQQLIQQHIAPGRLYLAAPRSAGLAQATLTLSQ